MRNVNQPLLYRYDLNFYIIRDANAAKDNSSENQQIGNPMGTPNTGIRTVEDRLMKEKSGMDINFSPKNLQELSEEVIGEMQNGS